MIAKVRGMGVAVITSTSGASLRPLESAARWSTPNLCCSSMTTNPSRGGGVFLVQQGVRADEDVRLTVRVRRVPEVGGLGFGGFCVGSRAGRVVSRVRRQVSRPGIVVSRVRRQVSRPGIIVSRPGIIVSRPGIIVSRPGILINNPGRVVSRPGIVVSRAGSDPSRPGRVRPFCQKDRLPPPFPPVDCPCAGPAAAPTAPANAGTRDNAARPGFASGPSTRPGTRLPPPAASPRAPPASCPRPRRPGADGSWAGRRRGRCVSPGRNGAAPRSARTATNRGNVPIACRGRNGTRRGAKRSGCAGQR